MLIVAQAREARKDSGSNGWKDWLPPSFKQATFGRKSEKTDPDQWRTGGWNRRSHHYGQGEAVTRSDLILIPLQSAILALTPD